MYRLGKKLQATEYKMEYTPSYYRKTEWLGYMLNIFAIVSMCYLLYKMALHPYNIILQGLVHIMMWSALCFGSISRLKTYSKKMMVAYTMVLTVAAVRDFWGMHRYIWAISEVEKAVIITTTMKTVVVIYVIGISLLMLYRMSGKWKCASTVVSEPLDYRKAMRELVEASKGKVMGYLVASGIALGVLLYLYPTVELGAGKVISVVCYFIFMAFTKSGIKNPTEVKFSADVIVNMVVEGLLVFVISIVMLEWHLTMLGVGMFLFGVALSCHHKNTIKTLDTNYMIAESLEVVSMMLLSDIALVSVISTLIMSL